MRPCLRMLVLTTGLVAIIIGRGTGDETTQPGAAAADGWVSLFDGQTLQGWSVKSGFATYRVEDGAIVGKTAKDSPNSFLVSDKSYSDFELEFEVLLDDAPLNSGVQIRSGLKGDEYGGRVHGPQVEIEASPGQAGFIYGEALDTGWLSPEPDSPDPAVHEHSFFKNGEWNAYRIVATGGRIQTWINGHAVADLQLPAAVAAAHGEGRLGLQVHAVGAEGPYQVRWRKLRLRPHVSP